MAIRVGEKIGSGANGTVYRGYDDVLGRDVAVKFFNNSFDSVRTQIIAHCAALRNVNHPNVVTIYGVSDLPRPTARADEPPVLALVMEYVPGSTFTTWLRQPKKSMAEVFSCCRGIVNGLLAFHERGLSHGDLHSGNIMISASVVKILDPLERDPMSTRTTSATAERIASDARRARDLVREALGTAVDSRLVDEHFAAGADKFRTMSEVSIAIDAIENVATTRTDSGSRITFEPLPAAASSGLGMYDSCRTALKNKDEWSLSELQRLGRRSLASSLDRERERSLRRHTSDDSRLESLWQLLRDTSEWWAWCLSQADTAAAGHNRIGQEVVYVLEQPWEKGGASGSALPEMIASCVTHFVGAAMVVYGNPTNTIGLLSTRVEDIDDRRGLVPLWINKRLTTWPTWTGPDAIKYLTILKSAYQHIPLLSRVFANERDYHVGIAGVNLVCELLATAHDEASVDFRIIANLDRPIVFPWWCQLSRAEIVHLWRLLMQCRLIDVAANQMAVSPNNVRSAWKSVLEHSRKTVRNSSRVSLAFDVPASIVSIPPG